MGLLSVHSLNILVKMQVKNKMRDIKWNCYWLSDMSTIVLKALWLTKGMMVHLTEWRLTWKWIWGDLEWIREWSDLCSLAWLDRNCRAAFCSSWLLASIWAMWLGCLFLSLRLFLFLRSFCRSFMFHAFLVMFHLASWVMVKDTLCGHAGKCPEYVTHNCHI